MHHVPPPVGTDILIGDPLGGMKVTAQGVATRDELVWQAAAEAGAPICMVLSGGYAKRNYQVDRGVEI